MPESKTQPQTSSKSAQQQNPASHNKLDTHHKLHTQLDSLPRPQIGVSACLMGQPVRFDGGHKRSPLLIDTCSNYFDLQTMCPEAELGLGIPRPTIQLRRFESVVKLVRSKDSQHDLSEAMHDYAVQKVEGLTHLDGFIFKKDSPSCGMERVPVFDNRTGMRDRNGVGVFAEVFKTRYPNVPTEEEGRLNDIQLRENFYERVYAHYRWRQLLSSEQMLQDFRDFHKNYKLILMARHDVSYRQLGRIAATANKHNLHQVMQEYFSLFMQCMGKVPSRGQHVNVLMHILGYLKNCLNAHDKAELLQWFETYRQRQVNRITPLVLLQHHFKHYPNEYMAQQYYFSPFPAELMQPV